MFNRGFLRAFLLVLLLAGCDDPVPPVVLVHASDPHLLYGKATLEEALNQLAFADMMDTMRRGLTTPPSRYLVVTGDFGIEETDPRFGPELQPSPSVPALRQRRRSERKRTELANLVATEIQGSPFTYVYFVPGNNDLFLESPDSIAPATTAAFVQAVNERLRNKRLVDLTACYADPTAPLASCTAAVGREYTLVGFPSASFKNGGLEDSAGYVAYMGPGASYDAEKLRQANERLIPAQDSLHREMMRRFRQVLSYATAGGRRALILTHIPDLEDPHGVDERRKGNPVPYRRPRLSDSTRDDAWNARDTLFMEWRELVKGPRVAGVLAGHFHSANRERYKRPYTWSDSLRPSVPRSDRSRVFVTPPLAAKFQANVRPGARGFSLITLRPDSVERQLCWYAADEHRFGCDASDLRSAAASAGPPPASDPLEAFNPVSNEDHAASFAGSAIMALLSSVLWPGKEGEQRPAEAPQRVAVFAERARKLRSAGIVFAGVPYAIVVDLLVDAVVWYSGIIWYAVLLTLLRGPALLRQVRERRVPHLATE